MGKEAKQGVVGVIGFVWLEETEEIHQGLQLLPRGSTGPAPVSALWDRTRGMQGCQGEYQ